MNRAQQKARLRLRIQAHRRILATEARGLRPDQVLYRLERISANSEALAVLEEPVEEDS